ncbi:MAG: transposase [Candidatus Tritonobacter lacicola]|nr:transposase [Candidatus Tritonobacter lacicola]
MPRYGRIDFPGALHHVIIRGINRASIFRDDNDRENFIRRLQKGLVETKLRCYAWVLMINHVHLLLRTGPQPLTKLMRCLLTGYAVYFNLRHNRAGYLFQNRYKSILCDDEAYLLQLVRYIHLNPLRANIISSLQELNTYPWCGHSVLLGNEKAEWQDTGEILERFGSTLREARKNYLEFVREGIKEGQRSDLTGGGLIRSAGGWHNLLDLRKAGERVRGDERILGDSDFVQRALKTAEEQLTKREQKRSIGWNLQLLLDRVEEICGIEIGLIRARKKDRTSSRARALFAWWATEELGFNLTEIAGFLGISKAAVSKATRKGQKIIEEESIEFPAKQVNK